MRRVRASARATRLVSVVIHRRPHCSATKAVVPEPQVGFEDEVAGVGCHEDAALDGCSGCLYDLDLRITPALDSADVIPDVGQRIGWKVIQESDVSEGASCPLDAPRSDEISHAGFIGFPPASRIRQELPSVYSYRKPGGGPNTLLSPHALAQQIVEAKNAGCGRWTLNPTLLVRCQCASLVRRQF